MNKLQGELLVASPQLTDPNFFRTVVLLIQHDDDGALGLVLNRPTNTRLTSLWELIGEPPCTSQEFVRWGGPVSDRLIALHNNAQHAEAQVIDGVYVAMHREKLVALAQQTDTALRVFSGYAGWGGGQLEGELGVGGWLHTPASADLVFSDADDLWERVVRRIGLEIISPALGSHPPPPDPHLN